MTIKNTTKDAAATNDYMGRLQMKQQSGADRYEKNSRQRTATGSVVEDSAAKQQQALEDETRSVHSEIDYKLSKTASRHIVQNSSKNPASLR